MPAERIDAWKAYYFLVSARSLPPNMAGAAGEPLSNKQFKNAFQNSKLPHLLAR
jgi:hypothetical protein